ncbi:acyl-CoA N-acyltransferase [Radiomyces spectabilis]|uniref:acyl-CoA N-acyltransferase n=1 Tax=Radiomyces spectabilis TaxID=64574 RepID=UPI00221F9CB4|nr:acyl-CoA N-acyltransferase [Radiomyces spectabilis]KAI8374395.1 acyl-CoA N-acyltransferase [Radiomyces spectabilis]
MAYERHILDLNYSLFMSLGATTVLRDDCVIILNPHNPHHQQSNVACRLRLQHPRQVSNFLRETMTIFETAGVTPRYLVDVLSTPSFEELYTQFEASRLFSHMERNIDIIMAWTYPANNIAMQRPFVRKASEQDCAGLTELIAKAYGYGDDIKWLSKKLLIQLRNPTVFPIYVMERSGRFVSCVILHLPPGLPHLGHVNVVATDPDHQRHGFAAECLQVALSNETKPSQKVYLEVYDEIDHAKRLYERVGFIVQGRMEHFIATR